MNDKKVRISPQPSHFGRIFCRFLKSDLHFRIHTENCCWLLVLASGNFLREAGYQVIFYPTEIQLPIKIFALQDKSHFLSIFGIQNYFHILICGFWQEVDD
jgi:hypothetical protein